MNAISFLVMLAALAIILIAVYISNNNYSRRQSNSIPPPAPPHQQPSYFNLLDDNGDHIVTPIMKIVIGDGDSDAPVHELQYFCIKDKGYHVSVWPKNQGYQGLDYIEFNIAGITYGEHVSEHLGEFIANLVPEPTNPYDPDAIKIVTDNGHRIGYVPRDITSKIRAFTNLPCTCYCYIDQRDGTYFSDCYITRKNP
jgi:hypothetical protein